MMALRAVLADLLAELALAQELDELRAEEDADEQRRGAPEENPAHQDRPGPASRASAEAPAASARAGSRPPPSPSATRSSPTPREPLTSTVSPSRQQLSEKLDGARRVGHRVGLTCIGLAHHRRQRPDRHQQIDPSRGRVPADLAVEARRV